MAARYIPKTAKAQEIILWLCDQGKELDVYQIVKAAFYADKFHVNRYGRPLAGDYYRAAEYGPIGQVIYGLLRGDVLEILALGGNGDLQFSVDSETHKVRPDRPANSHALSKSDVEALSVGLQIIDGKSFDDLVAMSHVEKAYKKADGDQMRYEDLLEDGPHLKERQEELAESASHMVF